MNVTARLVADEEYRNKYRDKLIKLEGQRQMLFDFTKRMKEAEAKRQKAESKKTRRSGVFVNGATSKEDIRRLKRVLQQKISEVLSEEGDLKLKNLQVHEIMRKIDSLERIIAEIERMEREKFSNKNKQNNKRGTESVYLTSDNLSVNKNGVGTYDFTVSGVGGPAMSAGFDALAGGVALAGVSADVPAVNVQV